MRPTHFLRYILATGEVESVPFDHTHYRVMGLLPSPAAGMPKLEAFQLVNKWNVSQSPQRYVYGLDA